MKKTYHRGELYYADLGTGIGSEQNGYRPVVVIQNDVGNKHSPTTIVAQNGGQYLCQINHNAHTATAPKVCAYNFDNKGRSRIVCYSDEPLALSACEGVLFIQFACGFCTNGKAA